MKNKITLTKGNIASGKSTWANQQVDDADGQIVNINKDDLRACLHNKKHSKGRESFVLKVQEAIIEVALREGKDVIISDINLSDSHLKRITEKFGDRAEIIVNDSFLSVSLNECILRDSKRPNPIGAKAIRQMHRQYLEKPWEPLVQDETLPHCCLFDLDGTVFQKSPDRGYFEWDKVDLDFPKEYVVNLLKLYRNNGNAIILLSGRDEKSKQKTLDCLNKYNIPCDDLIMRTENDMRSDDIVKKELFDQHVRDKYYVECVVDDRPKVLRLWFELGLNCFSVNHPDNEF